MLNRPALAALQQYNFELIKRATDDLRADIRSVITQGVIQGQGISQISRQLTTGTALQKGTFAKVETRARVISRTETIRAFSQGVQWQFAQNGIKRVQWMTARDERVCEWCGPLDGLIFPLDQLPQGGPPIHPQCRCMIRPVIAATEEEGKVIDLEAERNAKEQRKRFEDAAAKRKKRKGAA
jgi:SPP1 gp7 family putative phage head morphogenesis protein